MFKKKPTSRTGRRRPPTVDRPRAKAKKTSSVFSYYASGVRATPADQDSSSESADAVRERSAGRAGAARWRAGGRILAVIVIVWLLLLSLLLGSDPRVVVLDGPGNTSSLAVRSSAEYKAAAARLLRSSVFNKTKLTIDVGHIGGQLKRQFPELADVSVSLPLFGREPVIYIQLVAAQIIIETDTNGSFAIDESGRAMATGAVVESLRKIGLPVVQDHSGLPVRLGRTAIPRYNVAFIAEVSRQLRAKDIRVSSMVLPAGASELHMRIEGAPYTVKFNLRGDARVEAGAFLAAKKKLESDNKVPAEYIDVRVDGRVYVK